MARRGQVRITGTYVSGSYSEEDKRRVIARLGQVARPVGPVVVYFAAKVKQSVDFDFRVGGRPPAVWAPNKPNTVASKKHGRVLIGSGKKSGIQLGMRYIVSPTADSPSVNIYAPFPGVLHQRGVNHGWRIVPRNAKALSFIVAGGNARLVGTAKSGQRVTVKSVWHPGLPRRPFVVIRDGLLREGWRLPLRAFLFEGRMPPKEGGGGQVIVQ